MRIADRLSEINNELIELLPYTDTELDGMCEIMKYSLENGGKRIRPFLVLEFCRLCGGDSEKALDFACAVEYIHTYSLIHDDLPCMDNDDMRRGKPSSHIQFGEADALLAGDALLTRAFGIAAGADLPPMTVCRAISVLSEYAGNEGMIGGQYLDLREDENKSTVDALVRVDELKTSALIKAACLLGCIAADADSDYIDAAESFAYNFGIAFQIKDDVLDVTGSPEQLGKPSGSDAKNSKNTYVTLMGLENAQKAVVEYTQKAVDALDIFEEKGEELKKLVIGLINRIK